MLKPLDIVITHGGGNKMRVVYTEGNKVKCEWINGTYFDSIFDVDEVILYEDYMTALNRTNTINDIINTGE